MIRASAARLSSSTQSFVASGPERLADLRVTTGDRVQEIRSILVRELPHATKSVIAQVIGCRRERISRELMGVEKFSEEVLLVALEILRFEGKEEVAEHICMIRDSGRPLVLTTELKSISLTRHADGSVQWRLQ